jgi:hypothetical protein
VAPGAGPQSYNPETWGKRVEAAKASPAIVLGYSGRYPMDPVLAKIDSFKAAKCPAYGDIQLRQAYIGLSVLLFLDNDPGSTDLKVQGLCHTHTTRQPLTSMSWQLCRWLMRLGGQAATGRPDPSLGPSLGVRFSRWQAIR